MATRCRLHGDKVNAMHTVPANSVSIDFEVFNSIGSGTFSNVLKCQRRETGEMFACKRLTKFYESWDDPREVFTALNLKIHPNILQLFEVHFDKSLSHISLIYEMMDSDLRVVLNNKDVIPDDKIRSMMFQILSGLAHLHANGIIHCDLKPENILIKKTDYSVKLGDFGSVQRIVYALPRLQHYAATRCYRPPECILTNGYYGEEMDIWAAGCIFYELLKRHILFRGGNEMEQYNLIESIIGPPPLALVREYLNYIYDVDRRDREGYYTSIDPIMRQRTRKIQELLLKLQEYQHALSGGTYLKKTDEPDNILNTIENPDAKSLVLDFLQFDPKLRPTAEASLSHIYFKKEMNESKDVKPCSPNQGVHQELGA